MPEIVQLDSPEGSTKTVYTSTEIQEMYNNALHSVTTINRFFDGDGSPEPLISPPAVTEEKLRVSQGHLETVIARGLWNDSPSYDITPLQTAIQRVTDHFNNSPE
jgi:hypothetical protein